MSGIITDIWIPCTGAGNCSVKNGTLLLNFSPDDTCFCTSNPRWLFLFLAERNLSECSWLSVMALSWATAVLWCSQRRARRGVGLLRAILGYRVRNQGQLWGERLTHTICLYAFTLTQICSSKCTGIHSSVPEWIYAQAKAKSCEVSVKERKNPQLSSLSHYFSPCRNRSFFSFLQRCSKLTCVACLLDW